MKRVKFEGKNSKYFNFFSMKKQPPMVFYKKKVILKISKNSQENTCVGMSYL